MAKVGQFLVNPLGGTYCQIVLDSGEKILVAHDKGGSRTGSVTIEVTKFMGFSSDRIFTCDLDSPAGLAALGKLTRTARQGSAEATPLGAFVEFVRYCGSVTDVKKKCEALMSA